MSSGKLREGGKTVKQTSMALVSVSPAGVMADVKQQQTVGMKTKYTLNTEKAILKKLSAARRVMDLTYRVTGGGLIGTADAATYELLKWAMIKYFEGDRAARVEHTSDATGKPIVQTTIRWSEEEESYTINLYNTKTKFMINGRSVELFMKKHLPEIHKITNSAINSERSLTDLNRKMEEQLNSLLRLIEGQKNQGNENSDPHDSATTKHKPVCTPKMTIKENITCLKCKKACRTKSTFCTKGKHWIHYNCEKLTKDEIKQIEECNSDIYNCRICKQPKMIDFPTEHDVMSSKPAEDSNNTIKPKETQKDQEKSISSEHVLEQIVDISEEDSTCAGCGNIMEEGIKTCEECQLPHHDTCVKRESEQIVCFSCIGKQINRLQTEKINETLTHPESNCKEDSLFQKSISEKARELRDKEQKLNKRETELNLKEKNINEMIKEKSKLITYIKKIENEKSEYEQTINTLKNRINQLSHKQTCEDNNTVKPEDLPKKSNDLAEGIHERVTCFILGQIDKQLQNLEQSMAMNNLVPVNYKSQNNVNERSREIEQTSTREERPDNHTGYFGTDNNIEARNRNQTIRTETPMSTTNSQYIHKNNHTEDMMKKGGYIYVHPNQFTAAMTGQPLQYRDVKGTKNEQNTTQNKSPRRKTQVERRQRTESTPVADATREQPTKTNKQNSKNQENNKQECIDLTETSPATKIVNRSKENADMKAPSENTQPFLDKRPTQTKKR